MRIKVYTQTSQLKAEPAYALLEEFLARHPQGNYFQYPDFFRFLEDQQEFKPLLLVAWGKKDGKVRGVLMGQQQSFGTGVKGWMSRRIVVLGGPLLEDIEPEKRIIVASRLLKHLKRYALSHAIYVEFRNLFDTEDLSEAFRQQGFQYKPHLNYLLDTDDEESVKSRMSRSRRKEIRVTLEAGAFVTEPENEEEVLSFYQMLSNLYKTKIRKPLMGPGFFLDFWRKGAGKIFLVKYEGNILGGIMCPIFDNKVIYEWYISGLDNQIKGIYPSALATWAPIQYGLQNGFSHFDFLGAGRPDENYGVREFKSRFGGREVCYGRYEYVVNKPLYKLGKLALNLYQKLP